MNALWLLALSWSLENPGDRVGVPDADVDAESAWEVTTGDPSVIVAVIDTGADVLHPALAASIAVNEAEIAGNGLDDDGNGLADDVRGWDFADADADVSDASIPHGTMVSGIVLALAPGVRVLPVKVFSSTGADPSFENVAADGIRYALDRGARVLQIAWELAGPPGANLQAAFDEAEAAGAVVVVAAGNDGVDLGATPRYPASLATVIAVAGTDRYDELVENVGLFVTNTGAEIAAPTEKIEAPFPGGGTILFTGTSAAAPHVAGTAALVLSVEPALGAAGVRGALMAGADRLPALTGNVESGRLNANNAVRIAIGANALPPAALAGRIDRAPAERVIAFDGSSSTSFYPLIAANWSFGDGVVIESAMADRLFDTGGRWPATLEVVDAVGLRHVSRTFVEISARERVIESLLASAHPYPPGTQLVTSVSAPGATSIRLAFEQIEIAAGDSLIVFDGEATGVWSFQGSATSLTTPEIRGDSAFLYLRGGNGGAYGFALDAILARDPGVANRTPEISLDGAVGVAVGQRATFTAVVVDPDGDEVTREWTLVSKPEQSNATLLLASDMATLTADAPGAYAVTLTATDTLGASTSTLAWAVTRDRDSSASCAITPTANSVGASFALLLLLTSACLVNRRPA